MDDWVVVLRGSEHALKRAVSVFSAGGALVTDEGGEFCLRSPLFPRCDSRDDAAKCAETIVNAIRWCTAEEKSRLPDIEAVRYYAVDQSGRRSEHFVTSLSASYSVFGASPHDPFATAPIAEALSELAVGDEGVRLALAFWAECPHEYRVLYCIWELIEEDLGGEMRGCQFVEARGVGSSSDVKLFKHTVNTVKSIGTQARHGQTHHAGPSQPMALTTAADLVRRALHAWLLDKCEQHAGGPGRSDPAEVPPGEREPAL